MTEFSRTKKYKELRERLMNDTGAESIETSELAPYKQRLNDLDANNFQQPAEVKAKHNASHARNVTAPVSQPVKSTSKQVTSPFGIDLSLMNENDNTGTFDNDYLYNAIREVKQYNIDQGNAETENTQINILRALNTDNAAPSRPYPRRKKEETPVSSYNAKIQSDFDNTDDMNTPITQTNGLTKEDIMAEVQSMVNGTADLDLQSTIEASPFVEADDPDVGFDASAYARRDEDERAVRQRLLNETTKMRAQLDDYEDNLNEVNDKMRRTNQIMNAVLIIVIIVLLVVLGVVIYFIAVTR